MLGGFADQASEIEGQGEGIGDEQGFGGVVEAEPGRTLDTAVLLNGVPAFGVALATNAQLPGIRTDLEVASQANTAIREAEADGERVTQGVIRVDILAGLAGRGGFGLVRQRPKRRLGDVGIRLVRKTTCSAFC